MGNSHLKPTEVRQREIKKLFNTPVDPAGFIAVEKNLTWLEKQYMTPYYDVWKLANLYYFLLQEYKTDLHYDRDRIISDFLDMEETVINYKNTNQRTELLQMLVNIFDGTHKREKYLKNMQIII